MNKLKTLNKKLLSIYLTAELHMIINSMHYLFMAALCNRTGHYIFAVWFLSSIFYLFSSPNLSGRRLDVYHTSIHAVALV